MNLFERVKNIIVTPKTEWTVISKENTSPADMITKYVLPLAALSAIASFIGYGLVGTSVFGLKVSGINWGVYHAANVLISAVLGVLVSAWVIDMLAPSFKSEKDMNASIRLTSYTFTPAWVGGLLFILPSIAMIGALFGLYGLYLLYIGLPEMKKTPREQQTSYFVVSLIVMIVVLWLVGLVVGKLLMSVFGLAQPTPDLDSIFKGLQ
ncbi:MAG: YIP1 family protein [Chitinophagaceae bacterium]|nr:YIP1 family protein [Chitinophagaceae bacterium]